LLSPDGKQVLYVTRYETESGLRLRNLESGEDHWLKYPVTRDDQESLFTRDVFPATPSCPAAKRSFTTRMERSASRSCHRNGKNNSLHRAGLARTWPKLDFPQAVEQGPVKVRLIMDPMESP